MLELTDITKVVGADTHIHPTNLVLQRGSLNVLLGPTLSGKTSLMRLMAGLDKPTSGTIRFDGKDVTGVRVQDRSVAMVYQQFINYPAMQEATRDYVLKVEGEDGAAPLLNVFGGKLTTYRRLAEHAIEKIGEAIGNKGSAWTAKSKLPGGDFAPTGYEAQVAALKSRSPFLTDRHARRLVRLYGTLAAEIVGDAPSIEALGRHYGADLYGCEVRYLIEREWARTAEDILWRRTKLGLNLSKTEASALADDMQELTARCVA